jgi:ppGpp synthetase/RelA/SpoT-type nucleotidyltranferase
MRKRQKEALLIAFLQEKNKYERLGEYLVHLIKDDPSAPKHNFHTITYRIKDENRFIDKIDKENKNLNPGALPITVKNFQDRIGDLLGLRFICLRLTDIKIVEAYFEFLVKEKIFTYIQEPEQKRSFILPIDPGVAMNGGHALMYSGYSSIHYQITLGDSLDAPEDLKGLQVEIQLRTILEEAWGEIDHKYRYAYSRSGTLLPEYIHSGFYNLSAYLQAAAMQAEYLCRQVEFHRQSEAFNAKTKVGVSSSMDSAPQKLKKAANNDASHLAILQEALAGIFGFRLTDRSLIYILKRFRESGYTGQYKVLVQKLTKKPRLQEFKTVFRKIIGREPFEDKSKRNADVINAVNFALFIEVQGARVAREGLRSVLKNRREHSEW